MSIDSRSRYLGCLFGMATGDAVGTTCEFEQPGTFAPVSEMVGGGVFKLKAGEWTDDTSMGLCLAESLIEMGKFDPIDQLQRYVKWFRTGHLSSNGRCFDIGATVRKALLQFEKTGKPFCGDTNPLTAGNGSLMRLAAVPLYFASAPQVAIDLAGDSSRTTHGATVAVEACRFFAGLIVGALNGASKEEVLAPLYSPVPDLWKTHKLCPEIEAIAKGSYKKKEPPFIQGTGSAAKSLEAALWAFHNGNDFKTGCLKAVNLGNDADTTAAIYGQLAGAYYGVEGIPSYWLKKLAKRELIESFALKLFDGAQAQSIKLGGSS